MRLTTLLLFFSFYSGLSIAQDSKQAIFNKLNGFWEGSFIKNNSSQSLKIHFYDEDGKMKSLQTIEDWHPNYGEFVIPFNIDSLNQVVLKTGYGSTILKIDTNSLELTGRVLKTNPTTYIHLKKVPSPPAKNYTVKPVNIKNGNIVLAGHLHLPDYNSKSAIIIVGGRGCYSNNTEFNLYGKLLRKYGMSVLVLNKRGNGKSTGDCSTASIDDLASDIAQAKSYLENHKNGFEKIGVLGSSAGGWVMHKANEKAKFDFMIGVVGPSTSVREQQMQSMVYGIQDFDLPVSVKPDLVEYTNMMFDAKVNQKTFERFQFLLEKSKKDGWFDLLDDTDIPNSIEEINNLWVRRHNYNPNKSISGLNIPYLAIYGEEDWIVPYKENVERLKALYSKENRALLKIIVAHDAGHGTQTKAKYINLNDSNSYWRFFRVSPSVQIEIVEFLKRHEFIEGE